MSKNSTIDDIFKTGLQGQEFDHAEALWQRMEPQLAMQQRKRDRKKYLLLLLLVAAGSALITYTLTSRGHKGNTTAAQKQVVTGEPSTQTAANNIPGTTAADNGGGSATGNGTGSSVTIPTAPVAPALALLTPRSYDNAFSGNRRPVSSQARTRVSASGGETGTITDETVTTVPAETTTVPTTTPAEPAVSQEAVTQITIAPPAAGQKAEAKKEPAAVNTDKAVAKTPPPAVEKQKKKLNELPHKVQLELAAGIDPFRRLKDGGSYALVLMRIPLNNKANVLLGAGYNKHSMAESYKIAGKESMLTRDVDAKLQGLTMLQFPILYEQPIPRSRFIARIGVTPVYIMEANVVNVANSFNGSVIPFRSFTLDDVNRFSVLFTPALQYRLTNKLSAEVRGNYGLTGLVKNSYINQSSENNNFKSIQVGMMFRLGKK